MPSMKSAVRPRDTRSTKPTPTRTRCKPAQQTALAKHLPTYYLVMIQDGEFSFWDHSDIVWAMRDNLKDAEDLARAWTDRDSPGQRFTVFTVQAVRSYVDGKPEGYDPSRPPRPGRPISEFGEYLSKFAQHVDPRYAQEAAAEKAARGIVGEAGALGA